MQRIIRKELLRFVESLVDRKQHRIKGFLLAYGVLKSLNERVDLKEQRALRVQQHMIFTNVT